MKITKITMIVLFVLILSVFNSTQITKAETKKLIGPAVDCSGKGLPPASHIRTFESPAWNSGGKTLRELIISYSLVQGVHPALVAAHASQESSMGTNDICPTKTQKSSLTGCGWPPSCASGCGCSGSSVVSDAAQIKCTAEVDKKAYYAALGGPGYSVYGNCQKYASSPEATWNCIFCTYVHGFLDEQACSYRDRMMDFYCKWSNYLGDDYKVESPVEIEVPEDSSGAYQVTPTVKVETKYTLGDYERTIEEAKQLYENVNNCEIFKPSSETRTELDEGILKTYRLFDRDLISCIEEYKPESWEVDCDGIDEDIDNMFLFCVPTDYYVKIYNNETNKVEEKQVTIKFALQFKIIRKAVQNTCEGNIAGYSFNCVETLNQCQISDGKLDSSMSCLTDELPYCCRHEE